MVKLRMVILKLLKVIVDDIVSVLFISRKDFFEIAEMLSFGLVINGLYGLTSSFNGNDLLVVIISLYIALKVRKRSRRW